MPNKNADAHKPAVAPRRRPSTPRFKRGESVIVPFGVDKWPAIVTEHEAGRVQVIIDISGAKIHNFYPPEVVERVEE